MKGNLPIQADDGAETASQHNLHSLKRLSSIQRIQQWIRNNDRSDAKVHVPQGESTAFSLRKLWAFTGPGFLISIAYMDPGNFVVDITAGAQFNYRMIWVLIFATVLGLLLQVLCARLGLVSGKHLAQMSRDEYGDRTPLTIVLWLITESAIIASDIPEIIGTAFALYLLFGLPLWIGVLITGIDTMIFLGIQYFGVRKLELFVGSLVAVISGCFVVELGLSNISWVSETCPSTTAEWCAHFPNTTCPSDYCGVFVGGFIPRMNAEGLYVAVSLLGAVVMPHNLYLYSALVLSRNVPRKVEQLKEANRYNWIECSIALAVSCIINVSILSVAAASFYPNDHNDYTGHNEPDLDAAASLLGHLLGKAASYVFAIALLAAGQSSTLTGTFAGQFVMAGFLELNMPLWQRNLITRTVAILPSLIVSLVAGAQGSTTLMIISSAILSFQLPFALVPLLKFTSSKIKMGQFANPPWVSISLGLLASMVTVANVYLIANTLFGPGGGISSIHSAGLKIFLSILVGIVAVVYFLLLGYLVYRPVGYYEKSRGISEPFTQAEEESEPLVKEIPVDG